MSINCEDTVQINKSQKTKLQRQVSDMVNVLITSGEEDSLEVTFECRQRR